MMRALFKHLRIATLLLSCLILLTGILYPVIVTGLAQWFFPSMANGSWLKRSDGTVVGSKLIGQFFEEKGYFWGRPSATVPFPYNPLPSSSSNLSPTNPIWLHTLHQRIAALNPEANRIPIPIDLITASGSGLDPDISPDAARYQVPRIAKARHLPAVELNALIEQFIQKRQFFLLGEPRVNVLALNQALDQSW